MTTEDQVQVRVTGTATCIDQDGARPLTADEFHSVMDCMAEHLDKEVRLTDACTWGQASTGSLEIRFVLADPDPDDIGQQAPFEDLPEIRTITVNQGFFPEDLLFWRRKKSTAAADQLSPYPSIVVNAGGVATSWVPKWLMRWARRPKSA